MSEQDHINSFFQRSLQNGDVDFREEDWSKMQVMLDREERRRPLFYWWKRNRILTSSTILVLLIAGLAGWLNLSAEKSSFVEKTDNRPRTETVKADVSIPARTANTKKEQQNTGENIPEKTERIQESQITQTKRQEPYRFQLHAKASDLPTDSRSKLSLTRATENSLEIESGKQEVPGFSPSQLSHTNSGDADPVAANSVNFLFPAVPEWELKKKLGKLQDRHSPDPAVPAITGDIRPEEKRWSLAAVVTPELNAPQFSGTYRGSLTLGGNLRYRLAANWFVSVGVNAGRKYYTGEGSEYHPPKGYWNYRTNGIVPDIVEGYCQMIELPLMVQYRMLNKENSQLMAGLGMSSYIMKAESYSYQFKNPNPGAEKGWSSNSVDTYPFKVIRASISYEHRLSPAISLAAEPHLQIPLQGIGWTNIPLTSVGSSFILRYHF